MSRWAQRLALLDASPSRTTTDTTCTPGVVSVLAVTSDASVAISANDPQAASRTCRDCAYRARHGNCTEPEAAGLWDRFILIWAPEGHATECKAFQGIHRAAN